MFKKSIVISLIAVGFVATPVIALAGDLHIDNNTTKDSTTRIHGICSTTLLGADGVTKAKDHNKVTPHWKLLIACGGSGACRADVYMTNNCSGSVVANVDFNTETGLQNVTMLSSSYKITGSGFNVKMDEVG